MKGEPEVIYEDVSILAVNKPAGMVVNRAETVAGETVEDWAEKKLKVQSAKGKVFEKNSGADEKSGFYARSGVVHRLDKDTSGVLIIAKTPEAFINLQGQFKERSVSKKYVALVHGKVEPINGEIVAPVGRNPFTRRKFGVFPGGREARTSYETVSVYERTGGSGEGEILSFLQVFPHSGRTHQIRVHLRHLGFPIVSDLLYAGRKNIKSDGKWCPRIFLHALRLEVDHPVTGKRLILEAGLPEDLRMVLSGLVEKTNYARIPF